MSYFVVDIVPADGLAPLGVVRDWRFLRFPIPWHRKLSPWESEPTNNKENDGLSRPTELSRKQFVYWLQHASNCVI